MPLVYVHGVNVRKTEAYDRAEAARDQLFKQVALRGVVSNPATFPILNPYWGKWASRFPWKHGYLTANERTETFGGQDELADLAREFADEAIAAADANDALLLLARKSLPRAIDALWAAAAFQDGADAEKLAASAACAVEYARQNEHPAWLDSVRDDRQLIDRLVHAIQSGQAVESFGLVDILDSLKRGAIKLGGKVVDASKALTNTLKHKARELGGEVADLTLTPLVGIVGPPVLRRVTQFFGDVLCYFAERSRVVDGASSSESIRKTVLNALRTADDARGDDKLIIVAHSMGGDIAYDLLTSDASNIVCDTLVTVGSQVALFEELKLFNASDPNLPSLEQPKVPRPENIRAWLNIYDPVDLLGYLAGDVFDGVTDYQYDTGDSPLSAHGSYFYRPHFHERLNARLQEMPA